MHDKRLMDTSRVTWRAFKLMNDANCTPALKNAVWANLAESQRQMIRDMIEESRSYLASLVPPHRDGGS